MIGFEPQAFSAFMVISFLAERPVPSCIPGTVNIDLATNTKSACAVLSDDVKHSCKLCK